MIKYVTNRKNELELFNPERINEVIEKECSDLTNVSYSTIVLNTIMNLPEKVTTVQIQNAIIASAADLISEETSVYQYAAARLLIYDLKQRIKKENNDQIYTFYDTVMSNIKNEIYDCILLSHYTEEEIKYFSEQINYENDKKFTYAGIRQCMDKYLMKDKIRNVFYETPQEMFMAIAMYGFMKYEQTKRKHVVVEFYKELSNFSINLPTPIMMGLRGRKWQFASCTVIDVDDTMLSIGASDFAMTMYTALSSGIGVYPRIRGIGSGVRNGQVVHTGTIPFLQKFQASVKSCSQGSRGGSATVHFPFFTFEIEDIIMLKDPNAPESKSVNKLDYSIIFNELFYKRLKQQKNITLFSYEDAIPLFEAFSSKDQKHFKKLYEQYEKRTDIRKKVISARVFFENYLREIGNNGRYYTINIDHVNTHSAFIDNIYTSNLCVAGNTKINILNNNNEIQEIEIKELENKDITKLKVLSKNLETNELEYKQIQAFAQTNPKIKVIKITDEKTGKIIICTKEHKIYTKNRGYIEAINLKHNDLLDINDSIKNEKFNNLRIEKIEQEISVYDITVENNHNFYANDILIHNCQEIFLPTKPFSLVKTEKGFNETGEIALCILANINVTKSKNIEKSANLLVRFLDELIDLQTYPFYSAQISAQKRRSLGIGILDLPHLHAKNNVKYGSKEALELIHKKMEEVQYSLIKASVELAKEKGICEWFNTSRYSKGELPIDHYCKNVDDLVDIPLQKDWKQLRKDVLKYGMRNCCLSAIPPSENSAVYSNSTAINPVEDIEMNVSGVNGSFKMLVPHISTYGRNYEKVWEIENVNEKIIKTTAVLQKFLDQGISTNFYYDYTKTEDGEIDAFEMIKDIFMAYKYGLKSIYYRKYLTTNDDEQNSEKEHEKETDKENNDKLNNQSKKDNEQGCESGACSI